MSRKLNSIQNWPERARQARYSATTLAKQCGVSGDTLRRHFLQHMGKLPAAWLAEQRQQQAIALLRDGSSIKETATCLGYKQQSNFTRKFKKHWGICPTLEATKPSTYRQNEG